MKIEAFFRQIEAFNVLSRKEFSLLLKKAQEIGFQKSETVFKEGEISSFVWLVKTGWVHLVRRNAIGTPLILFTMTPREILCGVSAFDQEPYAADGLAATECTLLQIPAELFVKFLEENSEFCRQILSICSQRIRKMAQKLGGATDSVSQRMARLFLASIEDFPDAIPFTHREIAQMIGTRTETSIRTMRLLREKNLIRINRSWIEILRPLQLIQELKNWLQGTSAA